MNVENVIDHCLRYKINLQALREGVLDCMYPASRFQEYHKKTLQSIERLLQ